MYASMIYDAMYFGLAADQILEMQDSTPDLVASCVQTVFDSGFAAAREKYHQDIPLDFRFFLNQVYWELLRKNELGKALGSLSVTRERFGDPPQIVYFLESVVLPYAQLTWAALSGDDREQIVKLFGDKLPNRVFLIPRSVKSLFKLFKALFRKDTRNISLALIKNVFARFFNA
jgi:hypothetical protein